MSLLSDLPDDILGLISIWLNGFDNCSLWMASDSKLKQRLVNNVITDFHIEYTTPATYLWPGNFLKKLNRLSRLSLIVDKDVHHIPIQNCQLFPIDTLKHLRLQFPELNRLLEHRYTKYGSCIKKPTNNDKYINLNDFYCNLEHLELNPCSFDFSIDFLGFLPQKLKSFVMHENYFLSDSLNPKNSLNDYIGLLPRTLTHIEFSYHKSLFVDSSKLPPNLTSLASNLIFDDSSYDTIPKSIKRLNMYGTTSKLQKVLSTFPSAFQSLSIDQEDKVNNSIYLERLENLESLIVDPNGESILKMMTKCPPKLKELTCYSFRLESVPSGFFGNNLTNLHLSDFIGFSKELVTSLPQSLTSLTISTGASIDNEPFAFFTLLPKNLKSFTSACNMNESVSLLPQSLTYLRLTPQNRLGDPAYFDKLPQKLETFICTAIVPHFLLKELPETLKHLDISTSRESFDDTVVQMLPRGLKKLRLNTKDNLTDASAADFPPNMKSLYLINNISLTDDAIASLPRSLMFLNLRSNPNLTDNCIKDLPRNLIELCSVESTKITSKSIKYLPKYLKSLFLPKCDEWEVDAIQDLPFFLTEMNLANLRAKEEWIEMSRKRGRYVW